MVALAMAVEELDPEVVEHRVRRALVRRDPLAAELVRLAADLDVEDTPTDPVAGLEHDHSGARLDEPGRGGQPCDAGPDDGDVRFDHVCVQWIS